jgi:hypothetical protein
MSPFWRLEFGGGFCMCWEICGYVIYVMRLVAWRLRAGKESFHTVARWAAIGNCRKATAEFVARGSLVCWGGVGGGGGKTYRILKFVAWSFRLGSVFLTEGSVLDSCYECGSNLGNYSVAPSVCLRNWTLIEVLLLLAEHPLSIIVFWCRGCHRARLRNVFNGCKTGCISKPLVIQEVAVDPTDRHTLRHMSAPQDDGGAAYRDSLWPPYLCIVSNIVT